MGIEEIFLMVGKAPLSQDRTTTGHNSRQTFGSHGYITEQYPGMDGEIIDSLLSLFQ